METKTEIKYDFITKNEVLGDVVNTLEMSPVIALDTEGSKFDPFTSKLLLLQLATKERVFVIDCAKVDISLLKRVLEAGRPLKVVQNAKFDYSLLRAQTGIKLGNLFDTMLAERILTCGISREISLRTLAEKYLNIKIDKTIRDSFSDPSNPALKGRFSQEQLDYSARDAAVLIGIFEKQYKNLLDENLVETAKLEFTVVPVVAEMELRGSLIDKDKWRGHISELITKRDQISKEIQDDIRYLSPY